MSKRSKVLDTLKNDNPDGPSTAGSTYVRHWSEDAQVWAWRKTDHQLYYRDKAGQLHAYAPGLDEARDKAFPGIAKKRDLIQVGRAERRALHKAERLRYKAIQKSRGVET